MSEQSGPSSESSRSGDSSSLLYTEHTTINVIELCEANSKSVLYKLRNNINGQGVVDSVVKSLVVSFNSVSPQLNNNHNGGNEASRQSFYGDQVRMLMPFFIS